MLDPISLPVLPEQSLAFWESLDQLLQSPSEHPWGSALAEALGTGPVSVETVLAPALSLAGADLQAFWGYLHRSGEMGAKAAGYARLANESFIAFRSGALGMALRTLLTNLRMFQHCRSVGDTLLFRRLLARLASYDIRFRRRFATDPHSAEVVLAASTASILLALDSDVRMSRVPSAETPEALQIRVGAEFSVQAEPYLLVGENQLVPLSESASDRPELRLAFYLRDQRMLLIREAQFPEGQQWLYATLVAVDAQGQVQFEAESKRYSYFTPELKPLTEPLGPLSEEELSYWQHYEALAEVLTRQPTGPAETVETKDIVIWQLLEVLETHAAEGVSTYVRQVCAGYLAAQLGYLSTEPEHDESPRLNSYRDYLSKEVENSVRRRNRHPPTAEAAIG